MSPLNSHSHASVLDKAARGCMLQYEQTVHILFSPALKSYSFCREKKTKHFFLPIWKTRSNCAALHFSLNKKLTGALRRCQSKFCREEEQKVRLSALQNGRRRTPTKKSKCVAQCRLGVPPPQPATLHLQPPRRAVCRRALRRPPVFQQSFKMDR